MSVDEYVQKFIRELMSDPEIKVDEVMSVGVKMVNEGFCLLVSKKMGSGAYGG